MKEEEPVEVQQTVKRPEPSTEYDPENEAYHGFLIVKCAGCGKVFACNFKNPIQSFTCKDCGHVTPLVSMAPAQFVCSNCGRTWIYQTNITDAEITHTCIRCGAEMKVRWNKKIRRYTS